MNFNQSVKHHYQSAFGVQKRVVLNSNRIHSHFPSSTLDSWTCESWLRENQHYILDANVNINSLLDDMGVTSLIVTLSVHQQYFFFFLLSVPTTLHSVGPDVWVSKGRMLLGNTGRIPREDRVMHLQAKECQNLLANYQKLEWCNREYCLTGLRGA